MAQGLWEQLIPDCHLPTVKTKSFIVLSLSKMPEPDIRMNIKNYILSF